MNDEDEMTVEIVLLVVGFRMGKERCLSRQAKWGEKSGQERLQNTHVESGVMMNT